jgi:hypothetical protein
MKERCPDCAAKNGSEPMVMTYGTIRHAAMDVGVLWTKSKEL